MVDLRRIVGVFIIGLAGAVLIAEAALRVLDLPKETPVGWAWRGDPAEQNELGFRGHRVGTSAGDTILLVGDSQVETFGRHPFDKMPEVLLRTALKDITRRDIRVVSVGAGGWGQDQQLLALRQALPQIHPRLVALWFTPANDLWNNTFPTHMPQNGWPKPTFWLEGGILRGPHAAWGEPYRTGELRLSRAWRLLRQRPMYITDEEWDSRLPPAYPSAEVKRSDARRLADFVAAQIGVPVADLLAASTTAGENFATEKTHASIALTPRSPRLEYSMRLTRALLAEIAQLCRQYDAKFLVFHVDTRPFDSLPAEPTRFEVSGRVVTLSSASAHRVTQEVLTDFPSLSLSGYQPRFRMAKLDAHLNEEGNLYFMVKLAAHLAPMLR